MVRRCERKRGCQRNNSIPIAHGFTHGARVEAPAQSGGTLLLKIMTLGKPKVIGDNGETKTVPGQQSWALLGRLLMTDRKIGRRTLANELFCEAEDPLGALRWCLASLRRALGSDTLSGDPIELNFPEGTYVDILNLTSIDVESLEAAEFLEGVEPASSAEFSTWLLIVREQISAQVDEILRRAAIEALAIGDSDAAVKISSRAVRLRPLDEGTHILLVKALAMSGKMDAATAHIEATEREFERQVGEKPTQALRAAARKSIADPPKGVSEAAVIDSLIKSGAAALAAGAVDAGLDCLRRAAAKAENGTDQHLIARTCHELGAGLVHAIRGFDEEGAILLRKAADTGSEIGSSSIAAASLRELGYVEALAGRRPDSAKYLKSAMDFAQDDDNALAAIHAVTGFNLVDWGKTKSGLSHFEQSLTYARKSRNRRQEIWALGIGAWGHLRDGNAPAAENWLKTCLKLCEENQWIAFQPWPQALLAEAQIVLFRPGNSAQIRLEESLALSSQLDDPCWEAANARSLALLQMDGGDLVAAESWLDHAHARCCSVTDPYAGLLVEIVADQVRLQQKLGNADRVAEKARDLLSLSARTHADAHLGIAMAAFDPKRQRI